MSNFDPAGLHCQVTLNPAAAGTASIHQLNYGDFTMRTTILALAMFVTAGSVAADVALSIPLKSGTLDNVQSETYSCGDGTPFAVQYVNSGANVLAILPIDGKDRIFVNVVSASGAKYVSGANVWWTKGDTATLEDEMKEGSIKNCRWK